MVLATDMDTITASMNMDITTALDIPTVPVIPMALDTLTVLARRPMESMPTRRCLDGQLDTLRSRWCKMLACEFLNDSFYQLLLLEKRFFSFVLYERLKTWACCGVVHVIIASGYA